MPHAKISEAHVKPRSKWCAHCSLSATQKWGVSKRLSADEGFEGGDMTGIHWRWFLLEKNARGFRAACEGRELITDLFSRAELDSELSCRSSDGRRAVRFMCAMSVGASISAGARV